MKLSKVTILALRGMHRTDRQRLAKDMGVTEDTLYRWIRTNDDSLTKAGYLAIFRKEFGLQDPELLETETLAA